MDAKTVGEVMLEEMQWLASSPYLFALLKDVRQKDSDGWQRVAIVFQNTFVRVAITWYEFRSVFGITVYRRNDAVLNPGVLVAIFDLVRLHGVPFNDENIADTHGIRLLCRTGSELLRRHDALLGAGCVGAAKDIMEQLSHKT